MNKPETIIIFLAILFTCSSQFLDEIDYEFVPVEYTNCIEADTLPCFSKGCFNISQRCDGNLDCEDGSDEKICPNRKFDPKVCNITHQFLCADKTECIPNRMKCNNITDCKDGSDEVNCTTSLTHSKLTKDPSCRGFVCENKQCISELWLCDGIYDCSDKSDENSKEICELLFIPDTMVDLSSCFDLIIKDRNYLCLDSSFCLPSRLMCDGIQDCRDNSDEGAFCKNWTTMCDNFNCFNNESDCYPDRDGPVCRCDLSVTLDYNNVTHECEDIDECASIIPECSHFCQNADGHYSCTCDDGYTPDWIHYLCYANGPEAMLFFSTYNDIRYIKIKTKEMVTVATDIKKAHGVTFDGTYVYWVDMAEGHQSIYRAQLENVQDTKQIVVSIGLEEPGDIAVDYLGGNIYLSDAARGTISACRSDGSICTTIKTKSKHPKFVTLDAKNGKMYWADWLSRGVIMSARMDGSESDVLVDNLHGFASGLAIDSPNNRLYFVDKTVKAVIIDRKIVYAIFQEPFHVPYSISVFENTIYWSDWTTNTILTTDKMHGTFIKRNTLLKLDSPVFGLHMYHPALKNASSNPCSHHNCTHLCLVTSNVSRVCACPDSMEVFENICIRSQEFRPKYLIVAGGQLLTRILYEELGNPETHATHFDIGRVQAMAYDNIRDELYIYDGQHKTIMFVNMKEFRLGQANVLVSEDLANVVDMDYDYASDNLYIVDAGRHLIEVISLSTLKRAQVFKFPADEVPISLCILHDFGRMMVAVVESEHNVIHIDSIGLNGLDREHIVMNNLRGPHVRLRYVQHMHNVFISDETYGAIDIIHPDGSARQSYRELLTSVTSLAVAGNYLFCTDRRTSRLFWSDIHEASHKIRRIDLTLFPNNTQLIIQATSSPPHKNNFLLTHPCLNNPCSDVCAQQPHGKEFNVAFLLNYTCLCPSGFLLKDRTCAPIVICGDDQILCHKSDICVSKAMKCDGKADCTHGEDEEGCNIVDPSSMCTADEIYCKGVCLNKHNASTCDGQFVDTVCNLAQYECEHSSICISRSQLCDGTVDCPDGDDELTSKCDTLTCYDTEFMCSSGYCILKSFVCDGEKDCSDGSDERNCVNTNCGSESYKCKSGQCVQLKQRCDGQNDCFDFSDEENCEVTDLLDVTATDSRCEEWEFACDYNASVICVPRTARCNMKIDCPGGSDEDGCDFHCKRAGKFQCRQELTCVKIFEVCNNVFNCADGSDETPETCALVNKTSRLFPMHTLSDCKEGFRCGDGQCLEWRQVCNNHTDCYDKTDENGTCATSCKPNNCSYKCQPTPTGPHCICPTGYRLGKNQFTCEDIDECQGEVCSQGCVNLPGSFLCTCHQGYAIRANRRSCKVAKANMSILFISENTVRSIAPYSTSNVEYTDTKVPSLTSMDYNIRNRSLYVSSAQAAKLTHVSSDGVKVTITNVGIPTKVAVDRVTDNVYFVDATPSAKCIRVCNVMKKRCAILQKLPSNAKVTAFIVDPSSRRMFYCVTGQHESVIWYASLSGKGLSNLATVNDCNGLAVDSFKKRLYVAETGPGSIKWMNYDGEIIHTKTLADHLQAPRDLAIFEDFIYYLVENSNLLGHCTLFGSTQCSIYTNRLLKGSGFVVRHDYFIANDVADSCEGFICSNVCALDENGPVCICDNGMLTKNGECPEIGKSMYPLFDGWSRKHLKNAHHVSVTIITIFVVVVLLYISIFLYYHFVYKPRRNRAATYTEVRFRNTPSGSTSHNPTVQLTTESSGSQEFLNPLQATEEIAMVSVQSPPVQQESTDIESDLDCDDENNTNLEQ